MSTLVFDQHASIHFQEVRSILIRIPEVVQRIRSVQKEMDAQGVSMDLNNFIASDNETFLHNYRRKEFAGVVMQLGLYDRYARFFEPPLKMVGVVNSASAAQVLNSVTTVKQMIEETFFAHLSLKNPNQLPGLPILTGIQIPKFGVFEPGGEKASGIYGSSADVRTLISKLRNEGEDLIFEVGVGCEGLKGTLELDPHLSWVWSEMNAHVTPAAAN